MDIKKIIIESIKKVIQEKNRWNAFRKGLRRINEGGLNRIMSHGENGFIVISANRSEIKSDNPNSDLTDDYMEFCEDKDLDYTDEEVQSKWLSKRNKQADGNLEEELKKSKFSYTPVYGGYHGNDSVVDSFEPSYIVYCHDKNGNLIDWNELLNLGLSLCDTYKQESVYVQAPNEPPVYLDKNGIKVSSKSSKNFKFNRENEMFFTTTKKEKRNKYEHGKTIYPQRFTADIQFESMWRRYGPSSYVDRMRRTQYGEVFLSD